MNADRLLRLLSRIVPAERRADWLERWRGELWALAASERAPATPARFALGAIPDAWHECAAGWRDAAALDGISGDLRRAWRAVWRAPGASLLTVLIVGVGAAALTNVIALVDATLLRTPPAIARADELFQIGRGPASELDNLSYPNVRDLADALRPVASVAAYADRSAVVGAGANAIVVAAQVVTPEFFDVVGVPVHNGPGKLSDGEPGVVLSHRFWIERRQEIDAAGRWIAVDGQPTPVVGVAAEGFVGVQASSVEPAMWLSVGTALRAEPLRRSERGWSWLWTIGRRHPGVTIEAVSAAAASAHSELVTRSALHEGTLGSALVVVDGVGLRPADRTEAARLSRLFVAAAVLVLVVALANVVGLQLTRAIAAAPATAMMRALGASRARLVRGRVFELLILTVAGSLVAWTVAWSMTSFVRATLPYPIAVSLRPEWRAFLVAAAMATAIAGALAIVPLARASRLGSIASLAGGLAIAGRSRITLALVTLQLGVSGTLLGVGGLLARSIWAAGAVDPGFETRGVLVVTLRPSMGGRSAAAVRADLIQRAGAIAGVDAVGLASRVPYVGGAETRTVTLPGTTGENPEDRVRLTTFAVDAGFFDVLRVPFVSGGVPVSADAMPAAAVFTRIAADRLWPDATRPRHLDTPSGRVQASGVTADMQLRSLRGPATPAMFMPIEATGEKPRYLIVRTARRDDVAGELRLALSALNGDVIVTRVEPYPQLIAASLPDTQVAARLALSFSAVAVMLSMAGLYAVVSRRVMERRREFGVRLALGATPASVVGVVMREVLLVAILACVLGGAMFAAASAAMRQLLFGVSPFDLQTLAATGAGIVIIALAAASGPARRAGRSDPAAALRPPG
ncbi:MAG TPA: FtsX-like permease family protein [Vicinamibacterales bacterium]|nr:FtsX-like permease family protein [Vicinamibacterales bacterium]